MLVKLPANKRLKHRGLRLRDSQQVACRLGDSYMPLRIADESKPLLQNK